MLWVGRGGYDEFNKATLTESIYVPVLDLMADFKIRTLAQMERLMRYKDVNFGQLCQAVMVLCGSGTLSTVQGDTAVSKAKKHTSKLNTHLMLKARSSNDISFVASPVTGGA
jgi:hypothetical protein